MAKVSKVITNIPVKKTKKKNDTKMGKIQKVQKDKKTPIKANSAKSGTPVTVSKAKPTHPTTAKMVASAFTSMNNRKGLTLQSVRKYITENYDCEVTKQIQSHIKKFIGDEFSAGRIKMVNYDETKVNFSKRFALKR